MAAPILATLACKTRRRFRHELSFNNIAGFTNFVGSTRGTAIGPGSQNAEKIDIKLLSAPTVEAREKAVFLSGELRYEIGRYTRALRVRHT